ncbi:MAG: TonB-dependent receptor domain-containing protein [Chthoniobacterales bacterium]
MRTGPTIAIVLGCAIAGVKTVAQQAPADNAKLIEKENVVDVAPGGTGWSAGSVGQELKTRDKLRTGEDSRAAVRLSDASVLRVDELTTTEILPPKAAGDKSTVSVDQGSTYFFSREKAREVRLETPSANGAIRGTEFVVKVAANGYTTVTMLDGELELSNSAGSLLVHSGEEARVAKGQRPTKTAAIYAINSVQWCLYYPGVLDPDEIHVAGRSGEAYREGDLLRALEEYKRSGGGSAVYHAQLYLAVGQVDKARAVLRSAGAGTAGRDALLTLIAAVTLQEKPTARSPATATEWIAESYYRQSQADLNGALAAAEEATKIDPAFGFAWTRVAELHFSFGRIPDAQRALSRGLELMPRNPAAHSLRGFLFSAENRINQAKASFEEAKAIDGALGDAWLGHGLCLIRQGNPEEGRRELQAAAALEPNRSFFHSYVGKALSNVGNEPKARLEFDRAKKLDPKDPTPWLYSAIENKQDSRINEAVHDLEKSQELNENRRVYRSQFLLDQDRAVRSANLAAIYQEDGMEDVSVREATRGVDSDYSNASAHLFLANSYNALRDPHRINLRYETPWFNELLLSNLLSPVGGGPLSQFVSEQEYSKMFEADRFGLSSTTSYLSHGAVTETASQFGIFGNISYSLDTEYQYDQGYRPNNTIHRSESYGEFKVQLTPQDTIFFQTKYQDTSEGDLLQYYNQSSAARGVDFSELQQPAILLLGYHHNWTPGVDTLLLVGRLADEISFTNQNTPEDVAAFLQSGLLPNVSRSVVFGHDQNGNAVNFTEIPLDVKYHNTFTTYTAELNQIWELPWNTLIVGGRYQSGEFHTSDLIDNAPSFAAPSFNVPPSQESFNTDLERETAYVYDTIRPFPGLSLTGGMTYDRLEYPLNHRRPPITGDQDTREHVSPKAGVIWNPFGDFVVRGAYTRSLGGVSFDESVQLEPNQVAGFNQVFRSVISESIVGSVAGSAYENGGILIENKFPTDTYVSAQAGVLRSDLSQEVGTFDATLGRFGGIIRPIVASSTREELNYEEDSLLLTANQLVGDEWSFGARYQLTHSILHTAFPALSRDLLPGLADSRQKATFHQGELFALYNHRSGFFARVDAYWAQQSNVGYFPDEPGDDVLQLNAYVGYRFRRNFGDITLGVLNINDQDYKLNPLNYYNELPREREFFARLRFNF